MTKYYDTFIRVPRDCPVSEAVVPTGKRKEKSIPQIEYELLAGNPYRFIQEELLCAVHGGRQSISEGELTSRRAALWEGFFRKPCACLRASMLPKKYGGITLRCRRPDPPRGGGERCGSKRREINTCHWIISTLRLRRQGNAHQFFVVAGKDVAICIARRSPGYLAPAERIGGFQDTTAADLLASAAAKSPQERREQARKANQAKQRLRQR
jgi:hypothetical protein